MSEPAPQPEYSYPTFAMGWMAWLEEHRKHNVTLGTDNAIVCVTCARPFWFPSAYSADEEYIRHFC